MNQKRLERVVANMAAQGLGQIVVSAPTSVYYLTGLYVEPMERMLALLIRDDGSCTLYANELFALPPQPDLPIKLHTDSDDPAALLAADLRPGKLGVDKWWPSKFLIGILSRRSDVVPVLGSAPVDEARMCKDAEEIAALRRASRINDGVMAAAIGAIHAGATETELADLVERTMKPVRQALSDAGLKPSDLNKVLLVGGSTRIPAVQEAVKGITGKEGFKGINPDECVAVGAAIQGGVLTGDVKDVVLLDVTPLSLGIETMGGVFTRLIDRNTTIPTRKSQIFSTAADGQTSVEVHVLQGEREMAAYNKTLGRFQLTGIAPAPRGVPQIEVTFDIDANGIVKVSAKDLGTGKEQQIAITASTNLSKEDIDKAVREAEQYAAEDKARKEEVDAHNAADQVAYQTEKTLGELGDKISAEEKASIQAAVDKLKEVNKGTDVAAIKEATEEVQKAFYAVSEKLYKNAAPQQEGGNPNPGAGDDGVVDADYETVD